MIDQQAKGRLITLHGIDGSGKSTVLKSLEHVAKSFRKDVLVVREPGGTVQAELVRDILKSPDTEFSPAGRLYLMNAARCELYTRVIVPALNLGKVVLSDRGLYCSVAYQGDVLGFDWVMDQIFGLPVPTPKPDLALWLDVSLGEAENRRAARGEDDDDYNFSFARQAYRKMSALGMMTRVNADRGIDFVETDCARELSEVLRSMDPETSSSVLAEP